MQLKKLLVLLLLVATLLAPLGAKTAVVLSGGGARGLAHIAVLEAIEAEGIPIDLIVGTSMGALVGALYSAGYTPAEMRALITETDFLGLFLHSPTANYRGQGRAFYTPFEPTFTLDFSSEGLDRVPAILGDQRILELLGFLLAKYPAPMNFDELPTAFRAISTDAITAEAVVHGSGSLVQAVRSSIAIPMVFAPFPTSDGRLLLDGGMVDNLPIDIAKELGATTVIASDVNSELLDNPAALESFTAIAMQAMTLATYTKAVAQHERADLLYLIPLKDINAMDFAHWKEIISRGEEQVALQHDELRALASRLSEERELQVTDANRVGIYAQLPNPVIERIVVKDLSTIQSKRPLEAARFSSFIGRSLDEQTAEELKQRLREMRITKGLASLSYEMGEEGTLILLQRGYGSSQGQVSMGFQSDVGIASSSTGTTTWFRAEAYLRASAEELFSSPLRLEVFAQLGSKSELRATVSYPHSLRSWGRIGIDFSVGYQTGGLTPLSQPTHLSYSAQPDRIVDVSLGAGFSVGESLLVRFDTHYQHAFLHKNSYSPAQVGHVSSIGSLHYSTMNSRFSNRGFHFDILHAIGYDGSLTWQSRTFFMQKISIGAHNSLGYSAEVSMIREPYQLLSSYTDVGGIDGIPGYGPGEIHRDRALLGLLWQFRWFEVLGYPSYLKAVIRGGIFDGYNPYSAVGANTIHPFNSLQWDVGAALSLGLDAPIGEVMLSIGASVKGKIAVIIGVY